jgi:protein-tyrosine phosphatase
MKKKVLFVCLGNICRSPMAEAIFKDLVERENLSDKFLVDSAGTANYHIGKNPDPRTIQVCLEHFVKIKHQGQQINAKDLSYYDHIIAMDLQNLSNIKKVAETEEQVHKIRLMRNFSEPNQDLIVPDPYYGNMEDFKEVFSILTKSCKALLDQVKGEVN